MPANENVPGAHSAQFPMFEAPTPEKYFPGAQSSQYVDCTRFVYFPLGQNEHDVLMYSVEYLPTSHP